MTDSGSNAVGYMLKTIQDIPTIMTDSGSNGYCFHQMNITVLKKLFEYKIIGELKFVHRKYYKYWHAANAHTSETRNSHFGSVYYTVSCACAQSVEPWVWLRAAAPRDGWAGGGAGCLGLPGGRHGRRVGGHRQGRPGRRGQHLHRAGGKEKAPIHLAFLDGGGVWGGDTCQAGLGARDFLKILLPASLHKFVQLKCSRYRFSATVPLYFSAIAPRFRMKNK